MALLSELSLSLRISMEDTLKTLYPDRDPCFAWPCLALNFCKAKPLTTPGPFPGLVPWYMSHLRSLLLKIQSFPGHHLADCDSRL